jgi:glycosyltransferase involved in cell wall biosynthesis
MTAQTEAENAAWHLITGEYPPQPGGVSDYAFRIAAALAAATETEVQVWCPPAQGDTPKQPGVTIHREAGRWSSADLKRLDHALNATPAPRRLFVQYVPHSYAQRAMNLGFCRWLARRSRQGDLVWTMVHEGYYPFRPRLDPPRHWLLSAVQRIMLRIVLGCSTRVYMSMPYWEPMLRRLEPSRGAPRPMRWLPVLSSIPLVPNPQAVAEVRARVAPANALILGHFGTFGTMFRRDLLSHLPPLLESNPNRVALLLGRGGPEFASELEAAHPSLKGRVFAPGGLDPEPLSIHLQACDLMIQPYEEGISTRRSSVMACLLHGRAIVSNQGPVTEPNLWDETSAVIAPPVGQIATFLAAAERLLHDPEARDALGARAAALYHQRFAVERTIATLLADAKSPTP